MKNKLKELDVDFIGGEGSLTKKEEQAISEFIKTQKMLNTRKQVHKTRSTLQKKLLA